MTFAAATWAPVYLTQGLGIGTRRDLPMRAMSSQHVAGLRLLMSLPYTIRLEVLYAVTMRWPVEVLVAKATWRYYHRVLSLSPARDGFPIAGLARWVRTLEGP